MPGNREDLISALLDQLQKNNDKLDDMKESYYDLKCMVKTHQEVDEKMHEEISDFIKSGNERLDKYNRQLEIHIEATELNKKEISEFKQTVKPLIESYVEQQLIKKVNKKKINATKVILTIIGGILAVVSAVIGILKSL